MSPTVVVLGKGALGTAVMRALRGSGRTVRVVSMTADPSRDGVEYVEGDLTDARTVAEHCAGAETVFHCVMPPYHKWTTHFEPLHQAILEGLASTGASLVWGDNMYAYGRTDGPRTEQTPVAAHTKKGRLRARLAVRLWEAHSTERLKATIVRAADFYGPGARLSTAGDFFFEKLLARKSAQWLSDPDAPHSFTYIDDFASAMVTVSESDLSWGRTWHAPTLSNVTAREFVTEVGRQIGFDATVSVPPKALLRLLGLFNPALRETFEMEYERTEPFLVDSSLFEQTFGVGPTSLSEGIAETIAWYRGEATGLTSDIGAEG